MGNVKLIFGGTELSNTESHTLQVYTNINNELFISISEPIVFESDGVNFICLDKSTAIKFSKELRRQIALMEG